MLSLTLHISSHLPKIHPLIQSAHIYDELSCTFYRKVFKSSHHLRIFYQLLPNFYEKFLPAFTKLLRTFYQTFTKILRKFLPNFYETFTNIPRPTPAIGNIITATAPPQHLEEVGKNRQKLPLWAEILFRLCKKYLTFRCT